MGKVTTQTKQRPRLQLHTIEDFTGGLNLSEDGFILQENESPDCLNVDIGPRGGVAMRNGVTPFHSSDAAANLISCWTFENIGSSAQVLVSTNAQIYYTTGAGLTSCSLTRTSSNPNRATTFKGKNYIVNGVDASASWDGSTGTSLGATFNDDLKTPDQGDMPIARLICTHMQRVFIADTYESATRYATRIRWSHPNQPEDWRSFDFIDVDQGHDGDFITALVPFADRLYIFKRNAVYVLTGYDQDTFQVFPLSRDFGTLSQESVVGTELGVFFFNWPTGLHVIKGQAPEYLFAKLRPAIANNTIPDAYVSGTTVGYHNRRVWVSVPYGTSTKNARTFVFDTTVGKGSWTCYDLGLGQFKDYHPDAQTSFLLAIDKSREKRVIKLDVPSLKTDNFGSSNVHINSYFTTAWFQCGSGALQKRWKRTLVTVSDMETATIRVEFNTDYDAFSSAGSFSYTTSAPTASGTGLVWDSGHWDTDTWQGGGATVNSHRDTLKLTSGIGIADVVRMKFIGPTTNNGWGLHQIHLKVQSKRLH